MMSRGSVIPLFIDQIRSGSPITLTDPKMTRFMMSLSESVDLVKFAFLSSTSGDLLVRKAPGCSVETLIAALIELEKPKKKPNVQLIGVRHGEKQYEALLGSEERSRSEDLGEYFKVSLDTRSLDYQAYFDKGQSGLEFQEAYTSSNTRQLNTEEVIHLIENLPEYKVFKERN
jgi:UDP-glucose 4-epimerase